MKKLNITDHFEQKILELVSSRNWMRLGYCGNQWAHLGFDLVNSTTKERSTQVGYLFKNTKSKLIKQDTSQWRKISTARTCLTGGSLGLMKEENKVFFVQCSSHCGCSLPCFPVLASLYAAALPDWLTRCSSGPGEPVILPLDHLTPSSKVAIHNVKEPSDTRVVLNQQRSLSIRNMNVYWANFELETIIRYRPTCNNQ